MLSLPAGNGHVITGGYNLFFGDPALAILRVGSRSAAKRNQVTSLGTVQFPGVTSLDQPFLRLFDLPALGNVLAEQPMLVSNPVAVGRYAQRGHRIHEAGG